MGALLLLRDPREEFHEESKTADNPCAWSRRRARRVRLRRHHEDNDAGDGSAPRRSEATTAVDLMQDGRTLVPAGSIVRGVISDVKRPGRIDRVGSLTLSFDQIVVRGREYPFHGMATQVFESGGIREEAGTAGVGAGVGGVSAGSSAA